MGCLGAMRDARGKPHAPLWREGAKARRDAESLTKTLRAFASNGAASRRPLTDAPNRARATSPTAARAVRLGVYRRGDLYVGGVLVCIMQVWTLL